MAKDKTRVVDKIKTLQIRRPHLSEYSGVLPFIFLYIGKLLVYTEMAGVFYHLYTYITSHPELTSFLEGILGTALYEKRGVVELFVAGACALASLVVFILFMPIVKVRFLRRKTKRTKYDGSEMYFDGIYLQLFWKYLAWTLLSIITLGIYLLWVQSRYERWVVYHTFHAINVDYNSTVELQIPKGSTYINSDDYVQLKSGSLLNDDVKKYLGIRSSIEQYKKTDDK